MDKDQIEAIKARHNAASKEVTALCNGLSWRMRIPVQETDSDVVISSALNDITALIAEVERLSALLRAPAVNVAAGQEGD